ncbi:MAG TPA: ABC transporter permease [Pyrinomonadaceae bacterium]|jgi:putative ABC transport system permease protein
MRTLWINLRGGVRSLLRSPAFAVTAILILGLGIGVNTLVFGIADAVFLRPLPYPEPDRLVWLSQGVSANKNEYALAPDFVAWRSQVNSFSQTVAFSERFRNFAGAGEPEHVLSAEVSLEFLPTLGGQTIAGRNFLAEEDAPGGNRVAILTHDFCVRRFASATACVGQQIKLDDEPFEVVGVLPEKFRFPEPLDVEVYTPLALGLEQANRETSMSAGVRQLKVIARLRPGVTHAQAQAELNTVQQNIVRASPRLHDGQQARLRPLREHLTQGVSSAALLLTGAVGFLWVLGVLNVGSLLFARTVVRRTEMAVRISLGANRLDLFKQMLAENMVLTFLGCLLSFFVSFWGYRFVVGIFPQKVFGITDVQLNWRVAASVLLSFVVTVLLISLVALWALPTRNFGELLKSSGAGMIGSVKLRRVLNVVVVGELALAVILLVGAGLMIRSFWSLRYRDLGFRPDQILTLRLDLAPARYPAKDRQAAFFENLTSRIAALPGVDAVGLCSSAPPVPVGGMFRLSVQGDAASQPAPSTMVRVQVVNSGYFRALWIPLVEGEMFSDTRPKDDEPVVVVNRALKDAYLPEGSAVGKKIRLGGTKSPWMTIVGVTEDFKNVGLSAAPEPEAYYPYRQFPLVENMYVLVRSRTVAPLSLAPSIRREVWALDREQPLAELQTLEQRLNSAVAQPRFVMFLLGSFALMALLLAAAGVFGIMSYSSRQRTREIAVRMALGAQRKEVIWMILREGLVLSLLGAAIGIACARALSTLLSSMLHGIVDSDPYTYITVLVLLICTGLATCYLTARRTADIDPLEVLRN